MDLNKENIGIGIALSSLSIFPTDSEMLCPTIYRDFIYLFMMFSRYAR
jgi:hypothetical protein